MFQVPADGGLCFSVGAALLGPGSGGSGWDQVGPRLQQLLL